MIRRQVTHVVQAHAFGLGYVDCLTASSLEDAQAKERQLLANDRAWMDEGERPESRRTRIVPVDEARCSGAYTSMGAG